MKNGKRKLIISALCLAAALAFAVFTVFAWFITKQDAKVNGFSTEVDSGDVSKFTVTAYEAIYKQTVDNDDETLTQFTLGEEIENERMKDYAPRLTGAIGSDTAIILKIETVFTEGATGEDLQLTAFLDHTNPYPDEAVTNDEIQKSDEATKKQYFDNFIGKNYLSNVIKIKPLTVDGDTYSTDNKAENTFSFVEYYTEDNSDNISIRTNPELGVISYPEQDSDLTDTRYFLLDYDTDYVTKLYTFMLRRFPENANLSTKINFTPDIVFKLG